MENLTIGIKGHVTAYLIKDGQRSVILDRSNALDNNFKNIIRRLLVGENTYQLNRMRAKKANATLATVNTTSYVIDPLANNIVTLVANFDENSFDDTLDELNLFSDVGGDFSILTGLNITKDNLSQLEINWKLTINNI